MNENELNFKNANSYNKHFSPHWSCRESADFQLKTIEIGIGNSNEISTQSKVINSKFCECRIEIEENPKAKQIFIAVFKLSNFNRLQSSPIQTRKYHHLHLMSAFELAAVEKWKKNSIWMQQRENSGLKEVKPTLQLVRKKIRRFLQETLVSSGEAVQSNNIKLQPTMNPVKMRTKHKMYLTFLLSSACIFLYQYQVAIPRITVFSQQSVSEVSPQVPVVEFCVCWNEFHPLSARFNELLPGKVVMSTWFWCMNSAFISLLLLESFPDKLSNFEFQVDWTTSAMRSREKQEHSR